MSESKNYYIWILLAFLVGFIIYKIYKYQEEIERKDSLIQEIERFQNQIKFLKENPEIRYQLTDEDIFEITTHYERMGQFY